MSEHVIDNVYFLSESVLFILVNKKEVKVVYTPQFAPGFYDCNKGDAVGDEADSTSMLSIASKKEKQWTNLTMYAEKERGYTLLSGDISHQGNVFLGEQMKRNFN